MKLGEYVILVVVRCLGMGLSLEYKAERVVMLWV